MILPGFETPLKKELIEHFRMNHIQPRIVAEVDDLELQKMLVLDKHGFAALPLMSVEDELMNGKLIRLSETCICHENVWIVTTHRLIHNPLTQTILKTFKPN